jgi:S-disulfanyl-L-cysteine oxidoreductase SoxD
MTKAFLALALILSARAAVAQTKKPASPAQPAPTLSTLVGVYTAEQADRGKDVYAGNCKSCHSPASHTGATFTQWWRGKRLSDLYGYVSTKMPKNDPGSLSGEDAADVVAFLLKMNQMPVGKGELPPDIDSLKKFRIETKRASATTTATRKKP